MRSNIEGARIENCILGEGNRQGHAFFNTTGTAIALDGDHPPFIEVNASAAATVNLPAAAAALKGAILRIMNSTTGTALITVQTSTGGAILSAGGAATTTIRASAYADFICNGSVWRSNSTTST